MALIHFDLNSAVEHQDWAHWEDLPSPWLFQAPLAAAGSEITFTHNQTHPATPSAGCSGRQQVAAEGEMAAAPSHEFLVTPGLGNREQRATIVTKPSSRKSLGSLLSLTWSLNQTAQKAIGNDQRVNTNDKNITLIHGISTMPYPQHTCGVAAIDFLQAGKGEIRIVKAVHALASLFF